MRPICQKILFPPILRIVHRNGINKDFLNSSSIERDVRRRCNSYAGYESAQRFLKIGQPRGTIIDDTECIVFTLKYSECRKAGMAGGKNVDMSLAKLLFQLLIAICVCQCIHRKIPARQGIAVPVYHTDAARTDPMAAEHGKTSQSPTNLGMT